MIQQRTKRSARRRGNVLIEFVMVIPLLAAILGFIFFFGWAMVNQQHVKIADRAQAWRRVRTGSGVSPETLNDRIFQGHLDESNYGQESGTYTSETVKTLEDLVDWADLEDPAAGRLAEVMALERAERGRWVTVTGRFPSEIGIFQSIEDHQGGITHTHMRDGREWRWRQLRCEPVLRDEFLYDLDATLRAVPSPGQGLAKMARGLYMRRW